MAEAGADLIELGIPSPTRPRRGWSFRLRTSARCAAHDDGQDTRDGAPHPRARGHAARLHDLRERRLLLRNRALRRSRGLGRASTASYCPTCPLRRREEFAVPCRRHGVEVVSLIAPTSHERIATIAREAEGFVYCVSSLGVTGVRGAITTDVGAMVASSSARRTFRAPWASAYRRRSRRRRWPRSPTAR